MKTTESTEQLLQRAFARLDAVAFGVAVGALCGVGLCAATSILVLKGGEHVGQTLRLLSQYFPGYRVTWPGAFIGLAYGFLAGFVAGWLLAFVRNATLWIYLLTVKLKAASASFRGFFDNM
jgi:hypothetical protein